MKDDTSDLAARLRRIAELTEQFTRRHVERVEERELAERIRREIAVAREQLRKLPDPKESGPSG